MLGKLILLFIFVPVIELYLLIEVGQWLGALNTIVLVIVTGIAGAALAKFEGLRVLHDLQKELVELKTPGDKMIEGVLVLVGGLLLLTPGIITDVLGFSLIIPFSRKYFREIAKKKFTTSVQNKAGNNPERTRIKVIDLS